MMVLNVGGGASRDLPAFYKGWEQVLLDIDPEVKPDLVHDAKELRRLPARRYDAVYCSHNLEHFYRHEVPTVLGGFHHVLKDRGFAQIAVPDVAALMQAVVSGGRDLDDEWYRTGGGPIRFHDVLYGWGREVSRGNLYFCHKCGFTERSLGKELRAAGFPRIYTARDGYNLHAYAFKAAPPPMLRASLGI